MRKKISFVVLSNSGAPAKQICASKAAIRLLGVFLSACLAFFGYIVYDYIHLKRTTAQLQVREVHLTNELSEIQAQRKQIQEFANEINALKDHLVALNSFEQKIRIIANIEKSDESSNLFGVGGSVPEDLDARLPLVEKHNSLMRDMHDQIDELNRASIQQTVEFESLLKSLEDQQNLLASTPAIRPISGAEKSWITSKFGYRVSPFTGQREFHQPGRDPVIFRAVDFRNAMANRHQPLRPVSDRTGFQPVPLWDQAGSRPDIRPALECFVLVRVRERAIEPCRSHRYAEVLQSENTQPDVEIRARHPR